MNSKLLTLLGFASKSGNLSYGFDATVTALKTKKSRLVLIAKDISPKSCKESVFFAEKYGVKHILLEDIGITTVTEAVGKKCGVISINDEKFAAACEKSLIEGGNVDDK